MTEIFGLLIAFQIKHFVADYPMQGKYMLGKFNKTGWWLPLLIHAFVHGAFTGLILTVVNPKLGLLVLFDMFTHFWIDRGKVLINRHVKSASTTDKPIFWWTLGVDQMMHHLVHYIMIYVIITY